MSSENSLFSSENQLFWCLNILIRKVRYLVNFLIRILTESGDGNYMVQEEITEPHTAVHTIKTWRDRLLATDSDFDL